LILTAKYLYDKFYAAKESLDNKWISFEILYASIIERLIQDIFIAWTGTRKFINGRVTELASYTDTSFYVKEIPYWAMACTNAVVDQIQVTKNDGTEVTLRDINESLARVNDAGEFFLPANLWMSCAIVCKDDDGKPVFLAQDRNLGTTAIQTAGLVSWASGTCEFSKLTTKDISWGTSLDAAQRIMHEEIAEELWISHVLSPGSRDIVWNISQVVQDNVHQLTDQHSISDAVETTFSSGIDAVTQSMYDMLEKEVWISGTVIPVALVNNNVRSTKPELLFVTIADESFSDIQKSWETSEGNWESNKLVPLNVWDIDSQLDDIGNKSSISPHFIMSYLAYIMLLKNNKN